MKKFIFIVSFVFLGQLSLAEEPTNSSHANTTASQTAASATTVAQGTVRAFKPVDYREMVSALDGAELGFIALRRPCALHQARLSVELGGLCAAPGNPNRCLARPRRKRRAIAPDDAIVQLNHGLQIAKAQRRDVVNAADAYRCFDWVLRQTVIAGPLRLQAHSREVAASRMAAYSNTLWVATVLSNVAHRPSHRSAHLPGYFVNGHMRAQGVIHHHRGDAARL